MSEITAYRIDECARMIEDSVPDEDSWVKWTDAQSELTALREELAKTYRSAAELANAIVRDVKDLSPEFELFDFTSGVIGKIDNMYAGMRAELDKLRYELTAAEQRNAELTELLRRTYFDEDVTDKFCARVEELISKPTESGASE